MERVDLVRVNSDKDKIYQDIIQETSQIENMIYEENSVIDNLEE